ncbi:hypothetical protein BJ978_001700 [Agromyces terreus]|uniref:Uncharacterized protein n=1 Tax=Agromyces terreus TaxID=424795 RepID=A0A9X2H7T4_9MICO|nr:peptidase C39 family protein [Agromyces terreus]MCP2371024.1 hypothetical protein [Agromyces terreus]
MSQVSTAPTTLDAPAAVPAGAPGWEPDAWLRDFLGAERTAFWQRSRTPYSPTVHVERAADGEPLAAVLTTRRPSTAAVKIVELHHTDAAAARRAIEHVVADSAERGDAAVKWELRGETAPPALAAELGFAPMRAPHPSADGTVGVRGLVRWHRPVPHDEAPYYGQTTLYTCGAVAGLLAATLAGASGFTGDAGDRDLEFAFWRRASNYPACEPVGLAVAMRETVGEGRTVEVHLDTDEPVLLEEYTGFEHDFRAELQQESRRRAAALSVPVVTERIAIDEVVRRIAGGESALLLIDEAPMHGETGPHWVLAHAVVPGEAVVLIQDPWITSERGETWVDTHDLPVAASDLDRMIAWGPSATRGVVFVGR